MRSHDGDAAYVVAWSPDRATGSTEGLKKTGGIPLRVLETCGRSGAMVMRAPHTPGTA